MSPRRSPLPRARAPRRGHARTDRGLARDAPSAGPRRPSFRHLAPREAPVSPAAAPPPHDSGAWLARYGELQSSLFVTLARPLGLGGPGGRDAFGDLFQIAVDRGVGQGARRRADPQPARVPAPGDRQPAQDAAAQPAPPSRHLLRRARRDGREHRRAQRRSDRRPPPVGQRAGRAARAGRARDAASCSPSSAARAPCGRCATWRAARPTR